MSRRYRSTCRHCWDPVDREGDEACAWCLLSPAERRSWARRQALVAAAVLAVLLVVALLGVPQA